MDLASSIWAELYGLRTDADGNRKSKLAYYSGRGSLAGWLRAVVSQLAVDQYRKVSKFVQIEEDREFENLANEAAAGDNHHFTSRIDDPEQMFTETQTASDVTEALSAAVAGLDAEDRLIMKLYYFDDLKLKHIAATFGYHEAIASRKLTRVQADIRKGVTLIRTGTSQSGRRASHTTPNAPTPRGRSKTYEPRRAPGTICTTSRAYREARVFT